MQWVETGTSTSWEYSIVPQGSQPGTNVITTNTNSIGFIDLTKNTCYTFYVRSKCNNGNSEWSQPLNFCTLPDYCAGDRFYDSGGVNGVYQNGENYTKTIYPDRNGDRVKAIFNSFQLDSCCDYLSIYNGPDINSPLLFNGNGSGNITPGTIASTHPSGSLTFKFTSNSYNVGSGWDATIICESMPACPNSPINIITSGITINSVNASWTDNSEATSWEYIILPHGSSPTGNGSITTTKLVTISNLTSNTCYSLFVRNLCSNGTSDWVQSARFCTLVDYCNGDHFYDTGGSNGFYQNGENYTKTISPNNSGDRIRAIFNSLNLETCCDFLRIYNGPNTSSPLLFTSNNNTIPGNIVSTHPTGALTFSFYSDGSITGTGWDITIQCEPLPQCSNAPTGIVVTPPTYNTTTITWLDNSNANSWQYSLVPSGNLPGSTTTTNSNIITLNNLNSNTCYSFYVRSVCSTDVVSPWSSPINFCTPVNYCNGDKFYDTGGINSNYSANENYIKTISPNSTNEKVRATFNSLNLDNCCDYLRIFDGPNTSSPLLFTTNGTTVPSPITSTHSTGTLTFWFTSDGNNNGSGWEANIECLVPTSISTINPESVYTKSTEESLTLYPNPTLDVVNITSNNSIEEYVLYDINFRKIDQKVIHSETFQLDLGKYSNGIYLIKLKDKQGNVFEKKIIKN